MTTATGATIAHAYQYLSQDRLSAETRAGRGELSPRAVFFVFPVLAAVVILIGSFADGVGWFRSPGEPRTGRQRGTPSPGLRVLRTPYRS
ncbi:hypothetical protein GCM10023336_19350 [Streptomyces similanensis]|uniref:Uncharacterized protein n=1 Tax=Streptomyces similanensis TaxID=1274988 RepID=A0ABP9K7G0_9ACTN